MTLLRTAGAALLLLVTVVAAGSPVVAASPVAADPAAASSGACEGAHGVTVMVQPRALGGRDRISCDPRGGGRTAARIFADVGDDLTPVSSSPGFVCRIAGIPADASCGQVPPADAYWSLWWSDGTSPWVYSTSSADGLTVPDGGSVAFTWVDGSDDGNPATGLGAPASPSASAAGSSSTSGDASSSKASGDGGGLPSWVAPVVVVVLAAGGAGVALARRRRS